MAQGGKVVNIIQQGCCLFLDAASHPRRHTIDTRNPARPFLNPKPDALILHFLGLGGDFGSILL